MGEFCHGCGRYVVEGEYMGYGLRKGDESRRVVLCNDCANCIHECKHNKERWPAAKKIAINVVNAIGAAAMLVVLALFAASLWMMKKEMGEESEFSFNTDELKGWELRDDSGQSFDTGRMLDEPSLGDSASANQ